MFECCEKWVHCPKASLNVPTYQPTYSTTFYLANTSRNSLRLVNHRCEKTFDDGETIKMMML